MVNGESIEFIAVDIDELAGSMTKEIKFYMSAADIDNSTKRSCVIPKIKNHIRELDKTAYEPGILSIGPYHHGSPWLQTFQKKKWSCLNYILYMNYTVQLHDYLESIAVLEMQARNCYLDGVNMDSSDFLRMLLLDGCFILVHLWGIDGIEICRSTSRGVGICEETDKGSLNGHGREFLSEDKSFEGEKVECNAKLASRNIGQFEHTRQSSEGKKLVHALPVTNSEPKEETYQVGHDKVQDKCCGHQQDGKWYYSRACHDILLLENQIPFFVVKRIYQLVAGTQEFNRLTDNIAKFVEGTLYFYPKAIQEADRPKNFEHLLHLFYMYFSPSQQAQRYQLDSSHKFFHGILGLLGRRYFRLGHQKEENELFNGPLINCDRGKLNHWRRAVQYHEAGIEFKRRDVNEGCPHSLLDIRFHNGVLEIPFLLIDQMTGALFRNFIAFEQTSPHFGNAFTAYAAFIAELISSPKDVSLLVKRGIIVHQMRSDEEVSNVFVRLLKNVDFDRSGLHYLRSTCNALEKHYQNRLNRWMAWLWQNHFSNPWLSLAVLAAILVLVCTILQLLFALLTYFYPVPDNSSSNLNNTNP